MSAKKVLVVDDNPDVRLLLQTLLIQLKCEVTIASNGQEAIAMADRTRFDLVIMDWHMPDIDGFYAASVIWEKSHLNKKTKIVACTAADTEPEIRACLAHGFVDVLSKSFDIGRLRELVDRHTNGSR